MTNAERERTTAEDGEQLQDPLGNHGLAPTTSGDEVPGSSRLGKNS